MGDQSEIVVRRVQPADGRLVREVRLRSLFSDPASFGSTYEREAAFSDADWDEWASDDAAGDDMATLLALRRGEPVGIVGAFRDDDEASLFHVIAMWVAPDERGRGLGRRLLGEIEGWIAASGGSTVQLSVADSAEPARRLYESAGYSPDGESIPSPHHPGVRHVSLRRPLSP